MSWIHKKGLQQPAAVKTRARARLTCTALAVTTVGALLQVSTSTPAQAAGFIPHQYIAKQYTEGLGRAPDQAGWTTWSNYLDTNGCSVTTLKNVSSGILGSPEFNALGYSNEAKVEVAFRAILNREPDAGGFATFNGQTMSYMITHLTASAEFATLAGTICSVPGYKFGTNPPVSINPSGAGYIGNQAGLQALLNAAAPGSTVALAKRSMVSLTSTLTIPAGVTLTTTGNPNPSNYADMGRLARSTNWAGVSVKVMGGAHLQHVWVDGARLRESVYDRERMNIEVAPGNGSSVRYVRSGNPSGATTLLVKGSTATANCSGTLVSNNLFDGYSASNNGIAETDGVSNGCESAQIFNNHFVDLTDVAVILFGFPTTTQASQVYGNTIVQAGNPSNAALSLDGTTSTWPSTTTPVSFVGAAIHDNLIWNSPNVPSTLGIAVGTYALFGPGTKGSGGSITNNTSGSLHVIAETGIAISGHLNVTVTGNTLGWQAGVNPTGNCPQHAVGASVAAGYASGTFQTWTDATYSQCWDYPGHP
ncbi:hypothetical protein [Aeromicrobium sp. P5_D10]